MRSMHELQSQNKVIAAASTLKSLAKGYRLWPRPGIQGADREEPPALQLRSRPAGCSKHCASFLWRDWWEESVMVKGWKRHSRQEWMHWKQVVLWRAAGSTLVASGAVAHACAASFRQPQPTGWWEPTRNSMFRVSASGQSRIHWYDFHSTNNHL